MITAYAYDGQILQEGTLDPGAVLGADIVWLDVLNPTLAERRQLSDLLKLDLPTQDEMEEIQISSQLYSDANAIYMTTPVVVHADGDLPLNSAITLILAGHSLITLRYDDFKAFDQFVDRLHREVSIAKSAEDILIVFLETLIGRMADLIELIGDRLEALSYNLFHNDDLEWKKKHGHEKRDLRALLKDVGSVGELLSKLRNALVGIDRLGTFLMAAAESRLSPVLMDRLRTLHRDERAISKHSDSLEQRVIFLLDATVGLISIEQNDIIRIFSVAAVVFLPPTLVASIYGMNFHMMPELSFSFGYPMALFFMIMSSIMPLLYFKKKGWL